MSWTVYLMIDTGAGNKAAITDRSITYNVGPMYAEALPTEKGLRSLNGMACSEAVSLLESGIDAMTSDLEKYRGMNPPNGWGSYHSALHFLHWVHDRCQEHPKAFIEVH